MTDTQSPPPPNTTQISLDITVTPNIDSEFQVGDRVVKSTGDYRFDGWVVCVFRKRPRLSEKEGPVRYVVQNADGILHIFSAANLSLWVPPFV